MSLLGDAAGFIPGEKLLGATAGVITMVGIGVGSTFNSAVHGDVTGTLAGAAGTQLAALAPAAKYAGMSFAESIPGIGTLLNVGVTARDAYTPIRHGVPGWRGSMSETVNTRKPSYVVTRKAALLAMLFASPVFLLFAYLGKVEEGIGVWICTGIVTVSMMVRWDLRRSAWFWVAILAAALLQIPFIVFVPWSNRHMSFVSFLPLGLLDYAFVYGCIKVAEKVMTKKGGAGSAS